MMLRGLATVSFFADDPHYQEILELRSGSMLGE